MDHVSPGFREGLRRELPRWREEKLLTEGASASLDERYGLSRSGSGQAGYVGLNVAALALVTPAVLAFVESNPHRGIPAAYAAAAVFVAAAWREGSRSLLLLTGFFLAGTLGGFTSYDRMLLSPLAVGAAFAAAPLGARDEWDAPLAGAARAGGRILFLLTAWLLSFGKVAQAAQVSAPASLTLLFTAAPLALFAAALLAAGAGRKRADPLARGEAMLMAAALPAVYAGLSLEGGRGAVIVANLAIAFLGLGRVVRGRSSGQRAALWEGIVVLAILTGSRVVEFAGLI